MLSIHEVVNALFRGLFFVFIVLATISAVLHGLGVIAFRPQNAKFLDLKLAQDQSQRVYYNCQGLSFVMNFLVT